MSDVEPKEFGEHWPDKRDVGLLGSGRTGDGHDAWLGELAFDGAGRVDEGDSFAVEFFCDGFEQGVGTAVVSEMFEHDFDGGQVGDVFDESPPCVHDF